ncbi:MAG: transcriptional regulator, partial [Pseudomonadota bacterium]
MRVCFGDFELDAAARELRRGGEAVRVEPQVFDLIVYLIEKRARVVSRDDIIDAVWDGRIVSDAAISSRIKSARQALGDDGRAQAVIKTVHGKGFRFIADVSERLPGRLDPAGNRGVGDDPPVPDG